MVENYFKVRVTVAVTVSDVEEEFQADATRLLLDESKALRPLSEHIWYVGFVHTPTSINAAQLRVTSLARDMFKRYGANYKGAKVSVWQPYPGYVEPVVGDSMLTKGHGHVQL